jgi:branched-chain amino acid transport system permease protein
LLKIIAGDYFMTQQTASSDTSPLSRFLAVMRANIGMTIVSLITLGLLGLILVQAFSSPREMQKFIRLTYAGITDGALLSLIALGLVLVYKATDVINFAHGEFMLLGGFIGYQLLVWSEPLMAAPLAVTVSVIGMMILAVIVGVVLERTILRPLIGEPIISVIMVTIGLSNIFHAIVGIIWGNNPQRLPLEVIPDDLIGEGRFELAFEGARRPLFLAHENLILIGIVVIVTTLLLIFFRRSKYGIAMRATADDQQAAMSMGISIKIMFAFAWSLAAVTAALAGLMIGETSVGISGQEIPVVGLRAFPVIILGGLDSIAGAIIGGLIIGLIETYTGGYIDPSLKEIMPYLVLLVVLMIRPYGLFGQEIIERV